MDFREINYILAIAKHQNITKAAEFLYVSQPTLSKFLSSVEASMGLKLFRRVGNKYFLTYAGERYVERAKEIVKIKTELDAELLDIRRKDRGILNVGFPSMRSFSILPNALTAFQKKFPNVQVNILEGNSENLDAKLLEGGLDIAFYSMPPEPNPQIEYHPLCMEELLFCTQKDDPVREQAKLMPDSPYPYLDLACVRDRTLLRMGKEQRTRQFVDDLLQKKQFHFQKEFCTTSMPFIMELVACGYGVSFLFETHIQWYKSYGEIDCYHFGEKPVQTWFAAANRKGSFVSEHAREFVDFVKLSQAKKE